MEELKKVRRNLIIMLTIIFISLLFLSGYSFNLNEVSVSSDKAIAANMNEKTF